MSGYLEVKYPFKSNLGLNPFKSWRRQWCILRPSVSAGGGSLAVYCSEAGAAAGAVPLPAGGSVRRTKSRSRPHAFAVFAADERKPCVLLAASSHHDAQLWMEKIRTLIQGTEILGTGLLKDSFSVTVTPTELSRKCGLTADAAVTVTVTPTGLLVAKGRVGTVVEWRHVTGASVDTDESKNGTCVVTVDSSFRLGGGSLRLATPLALELSAALARRPRRALSHTDLTAQHETTSRSSWSSDPSEVSLDDLELLNKDSSGGLQRGRAPWAPETELRQYRANTFDNSMTDRRSLLSIASGIYEEIPDDGLYCSMDPGAPCDPTVPRDSCDTVDTGDLVEPTYESVAECVYATVRRRKHPPPLPPRAPFGTMKAGSWNSRRHELSAVTRHSSLGSLHSLPERGHAKRQPFSVFRKRLTSDSRLLTSSKATNDISKENKDLNVENKKKKFDFPPTKDLFKNFKVSRKMKNLKISGGLAKAETKSCEYLDETKHVPSNRNSKSVECLDNEFYDEFDCDLSIDFNDDAVAALALPQEIVDVMLRAKCRKQFDKIFLKPLEDEYLPMSPIVPIAVSPVLTVSAPVEHHYTVMSPRSNVA